MFDGAAVPLDENMAIATELLEQCKENELILEVEAGIVGGEEDGVDHSGVGREKLYSTPEDMLGVAEALNPIGHRYLFAATFGNVHGVYKPGNVKLTPKILLNSQKHIQENFSTEANPVNFVFHGGSGSTREEIREAISYGVIKMNIDTDLQYAYMAGVRDYMAEKTDYLQGQIGNPEGDDVPNKKFYDPRKWVRLGEESFKERLKQAFEDLNNVNTL